MNGHSTGAMVTTGLLAFATAGGKRDVNTLYYFVGIDKARFKRQVEPGDQLRFEVSLTRKLRGIWMYTGTAFVGDEPCCSAELMCAYRDAE